MSFWKKNNIDRKVIKKEHSISSEQMREEIEGFFKIKTSGVWIEELPGDASDRKFYRVRFQKKGSYASREHFVLMVLDNGPHAAEIPYINVQRFMKKRNIPVPEIFHFDFKKGYLFLEDLGDVTYERRVKSVSRSERESYYRWAIDLLVQMQFECSDQGKDNCIAFEQFFDKEKFMYEFKFFLSNLIEKYYSKKIEDQDSEIFQRDFSLIAETLAAEEKCFTHRDFHSRNVMIKDGRLILIDFQDARMGCFQYDLASLLRDSYISLDANLMSSMLDYYLRKWNEMGMKGVDRYKFRKIFDYACLQRNIKAAGTFGYLVTVKKLKKYEQYLAPTFEYIHHNLEKYREFRELKQTLGKYIAELK
ncbi:MAG: hypothetical protein A2161_13455 [Candidatus Schekmanbacteria bacterium RBG_13_48_7]|uniref:Aminoglycoside phosphotransferase domain-containing protein n=1 Tax=Candidatus Schekmanbacteria bacterium RBG_13_48_7 TaxID=1817878 RepID=A0A1F7S9H3_9BACT|nr:MAG: hypothetical protein A2161_13455 [Candidatus Schekmanbacteria bacterium RBG_13_48_7]